MRASGVNATIMGVIGKLEQKIMGTIGIVRIEVARITGFYVATKHIAMSYDSNENIRIKKLLTILLSFTFSFLSEIV